jgi:hypothetical protein
MGIINQVNAVLKGRIRENRIFLIDSDEYKREFIEVKDDSISLANVDEEHRLLIIEKLKKVKKEIKRIKIVKAFFAVKDKIFLIDDIAPNGGLYKSYTLVFLDLSGRWELVQGESCEAAKDKINNALFSYPIKEFFTEEFWNDIKKSEARAQNSRDIFFQCGELTEQKINEIETEIQKSLQIL